MRWGGSGKDLGHLFHAQIDVHFTITVTSVSCSTCLRLHVRFYVAKVSATENKNPCEDRKYSEWSFKLQFLDVWELEGHW